MGFSFARRSGKKRQKLEKLLRDELEDVSAVALDSVTPKLILNGFSQSNLRSLLLARPELSLDKICSRCVDTRYIEFARLVTARDRQGAWLWPDVNQWTGLPYYFDAAQINRLGHVAEKGRRLFPSLHSVICSQAALVSSQMLEQLIRMFGGRDFFPELRDYLAQQGAVDTLRWMQRLPGADSKYLGWRPMDAPTCQKLFRRNTRLPQEIDQLLRFRDSRGKGKFCYLQDVLAFIESGGTAERLAEYAEVQGPSGWLNGYEISLCQHFSKMYPELLPANIAAWSDSWDSVNAKICAIRTGGWHSFRNDGRPKALLLLSAEDPRKGGWAFLEAMDFLREFGLHLDLKIICADTRSKLLRSLQTDGLEIDYLLLCYHGSPDLMDLGRDLSRYGFPGKKSDREIKIGDEDFLLALNMLKPKTSVALISCLTARGGSFKTNLAHEISVRAKNVRVIAARTKMCVAAVQFFWKGVPEISFEGDLPGITVFYPSLPDTHVTPFSGEPLSEEDFARWAQPLNAARERRVLQYLHRTVRNRDSFDEATQDEAWENVIALPQVQEYQTFTGEQRRSLTSHGFVFGLLLEQAWCPVYGQKITAAMRKPWDFLIELGYDFVQIPRSGDLVLYLTVESEKGLWEVAEFGVWIKGKVLRCPLHAAIMPLEYCPGEYSHVMFMRRS